MPPYSFQDPNVGQAAANIGTAWFGNPQLRQASALSRAQQNLAMSGIDLNSTKSREITETLRARAAAVDATRNLQGYTSPQEAEFAARTMGLPGADPAFAFGVSNTGDPSNPNGAFRNAAIQGRGISKDTPPTLELFKERLATDHTNALALQAAKQAGAPIGSDEVKANWLVDLFGDNPEAGLDRIDPLPVPTVDSLKAEAILQASQGNPAAILDLIKGPLKPIILAAGAQVRDPKDPNTILADNPNVDQRDKDVADLKARALKLDNAAKVQKMQFPIQEAILSQFGRSSEGDTDEVDPKVINAVTIRVNRLMASREGISVPEAVNATIKQMRAAGELNEGGAFFGDSWWFGSDIQLEDGVSMEGDAPIDLQPAQPPQAGSPSRAYQDRALQQPQAAPSERAVISTEAEFNALAPGTPFIFNGRPGTKR